MLKKARCVRKRKKKISASHKVGAIEVVDNIQGVPPPSPSEYMV